MKFIRRDYTAFVGIPNTRAETQDFMCSEIADMIVGSETGWEYDTRTPNKTAFIRLPVGTTSQPEPPVLYLRNETSGCKMMIVSILFNYGSGNISLNYNPTCRGIFMNGKGHSVNYFASGIGISVIPGGASDEFPNTYNSETVFSSQTPKMMCESSGTDSNSTYNTSNTSGCMSRLFNGASEIVSYGVLVDEYSVTLLCGSSPATRGSMLPAFTCGKVFGTLAYDTELQQQYYGAIRYSNATYSSTSSLSYGVVLSSSTTKNLFGAVSTYGSTFNSALDYSCQCFNQAGTLLESCYYGACGFELLSPRITNSQSPDLIRWCPGIVYDSSSETPVYTNGDNFKGYLDTNLIRYVIANKGQLFNNGQFCCVADNLLLKWDPDATDTIMA